MRVITESVRGITIHWPKGMPLAYMNRVLEHLVNGHNTLNSLVVEYLGREGEDRFQYLGWVNDEDYWLKEIVGVGERLLPADCFGHPIVSKERN